MEQCICRSGLQPGILLTPLLNKPFQYAGSVNGYIRVNNKTISYTVVKQIAGNVAKGPLVSLSGEHNFRAYAAEYKIRGKLFLEFLNSLPSGAMHRHDHLGLHLF